MKATDLMCGDLILVNKRPTRVYGVMERMGRVYDTMTNDISLKRCEPIPLTPEILEKNGFMQLEGCEKEDSVFYALSDMFAKVRWNGEKITDAVFGENILYFPAKRGLRYVHELQHAIRLCGIDKTIEL